MNLHQTTKARCNTRAGFTLLELLIVLFLLSLGYLTLYSAGFEEDETDKYAETINESREIIRYARRYAIAKGMPVMVTVSADGISLHDHNGSDTIMSPLNESVSYQTSSDYTLSNGTLRTSGGTQVSAFYFDYQGRLASRDGSSGDFYPLQERIAVTIKADDGSTNTFLLLSNVTGELMPV